MTKSGMTGDMQPTHAGAVWVKARAALKHELGDATFGSWVAQAALLEDPSGALVVVTPTGFAADWIRRNVWRRMLELWKENDPEGRRLNLKSKGEFEACGLDSGLGRPRLAIEPSLAPAAPEPAVEKGPRAPRPAGLQDRFTFDTFVAGPTNEFAHAVARRVASWADGHFNPVVFHAPYGFGKTHLMNALAWEAARSSSLKAVVVRSITALTKVARNRSAVR